MYCGYIKRKRLQWKPSRSLQFLHMTVINSRKFPTGGHSDVPTNSVSGQHCVHVLFLVIKCDNVDHFNSDRQIHGCWLILHEKNDNNKKRKSLTEETIWNKENWMNVDTRPQLPASPGKTPVTFLQDEHGSNIKLQEACLSSFGKMTLHRFFFLLVLPAILRH